MGRNGAQKKYDPPDWRECHYQVQDEKVDITYLDEVLRHLYDRKIEEDVISRLDNYLKQEEYDSDSFYLDFMECEYGEYGKTNALT